MASSGCRRDVVVVVVVGELEECKQYPQLPVPAFCLREGTPSQCGMAIFIALR